MAGAFSGVMIAGNTSPIGKEMFGLSAGTAALFVSLFAAASMTGRLSFGSASDRLGQVPSLMTVFAP